VSPWWPFQSARRLLRKRTISADGTAPAKNQGAMNRGAQREYSDELAPNQTGDQYRQTEAMNGNTKATSQADFPGRIQSQTPVKSAEHRATIAAPEARDMRSKTAFTANCDYTGTGAPLRAQRQANIAHLESSYKEKPRCYKPPSSGVPSRSPSRCPPSKLPCTRELCRLKRLDLTVERKCISGQIEPQLQ